jgi:outer membrane protein insertion porin family
VTLDEAALRRALDLAPGAPWSEAAVEQGRRVLERRYARAGRLAARVEAASEPRDGVVDVTYTIAEGPLTRVGRVLVRGLTRTRLAVVTRELPLAPGDPLDPEALVEAQRRLGALGIFEAVDVDPLRPAPTPFADVTVTVREGKPWHLAGGVGYSTFERARVFVEAGHDNILGTARSLALRLRASERGERGDVLYREPWLLGTPWVGEGNLFYEQRDEIGYDLERVGLALGIQRDLWVERIRGLRGAVRYEIARVERSDVDPALLEEHVREGTEVVASVTNEVTLDRRDHPLDPRRGSFHLASLEVGGAALGGEADFVKARLETAWFLDWLPPGVLAVGLRLGLATALGDTVEIPIEKRFFAGGATTVRGYRERRLGPLDDRGNPTGGDGFFVLNLEWRFPIWRWLGGAVFLDTGAVTARATDLAPDELRSGVGAGLRVASPVGPVRLDVAYPLDSVPGQEQTFRVYVTVGYPF